MLQVCICVGSSCHLKGSYHVINTFQELIRKNRLQEDVELKGSFCLQHCTKGIAVRIGDSFVEDITLSNIEEKFNQHILARFGKG